MCIYVYCVCRERRLLRVGFDDDGRFQGLGAAGKSNAKAGSHADANDAHPHSVRVYTMHHTTKGRVSVEEGGGEERGGEEVWDVLRIKRTEEARPASPPAVMYVIPLAKHWSKRLETSNSLSP